MVRNFTLSVILSLCASLFCKFANGITYVDNGTSTTYSLNSGDSLYIASGTYTGSITGFPSGAKITVSDLAVFQPSSFPNTNGNSAKGTMWVYGTFTFNNTFLSNDGFTLHNYGTVTLGNTTLKGSGQTWTNHYGGTINFTSDVLMNGDFGNNNVFLNYQTVNCSGNFQMNSGSLVYNYKDFAVTGNYTVNGGTLDNQGKLQVTGAILLNNGASVIRNYCRMEASTGITNTSGNFYNYNYLRAINSDITNKSNIINVSVSNAGSPLSKPMIEGRNYFQSGSSTVTGPALLYFTGTTSITGGSIGAGSSTTDTIKMNDITRSMPSQILDVQGGTINPNVIYNAWGVPDPSYTYLFGCSLEVFLEIPLAINWKSFDVVLSKDIPLLIWSAEFDRQTVFEIQRSYDGRSFSAIDQVQSIEGRTDYRYNDRFVNDQSNLVYYRIKAVELDGDVKYTQTRIVKFNHKPGSVYTAPNPFTNDFVVNYKAAERETITLRMLNISGQQMLVKNVTVNSGNNNINITEAAQLAKGIYVMQVNKGHNLISSVKLIKQ